MQIWIHLTLLLCLKQHHGKLWDFSHFGLIQNQRRCRRFSFTGILHFNAVARHMTTLRTVAYEEGGTLSVKYEHWYLHRTTCVCSYGNSVNLRYEFTVFVSWFEQMVVTIVESFPFWNWSWVHLIAFSICIKGFLTEGQTVILSCRNASLWWFLIIVLGQFIYRTSI